MFKTLLKKLVGDKAEGDMKEIQPVVDAVHGFEADMKALSDDGLRSRSEDLRQRIQAHVANLEKEEQALRADASAMGEDQLEQKEAHTLRVMDLENQVYNKGTSTLAKLHEYVEGHVGGAERTGLLDERAQAQQRAKES